MPFFTRRPPMSSARRVDFDSSVAIVIWGAGSGARSQRPPATMVQMLARAVRDMNPLGDQLEEMRGAARRAIGRAANAVVTHLEESKDRVAPAPASLSLSRAYSPLRHGRFAAMIPGDSAVEQVITSGLFSTLNIYNTLLIGRLILTWCVAFGAMRRDVGKPTIAFDKSRDDQREPALFARHDRSP